MDPLLRKLLDAWSGPLGVSLVDLALAGLTALACGFVIGETYRRTYRGHDYSRSFLQVLLVITLLVAFVTLVVGNDLARAFTLVGAMSVVRFRTAVKEARDLAFIFWAVATGMGAGSRFVALTVAFTLAVALVVVLLTWRGWGVRDPELQVLRVWSEALSVERGCDLGSPLIGAPALAGDRIYVTSAEAGLQALSVDLETVHWAVKPDSLVAAAPRSGPVLVDIDRDGEQELAVRWLDMRSPTGPEFALWLFSARGEPLRELDVAYPAAFAGGHTLYTGQLDLVRALGPWRRAGEPRPLSLDLVARQLAGGAWARAYDDAERLGPRADLLRALASEQLGGTPPALDPAQVSLELDLFFSRYRPPYTVADALLAPRGHTVSFPPAGRLVPVTTDPLPDGAPRSATLRKLQPPRSNGLSFACTNPVAPSWLGGSEALAVEFTVDEPGDHTVTLRHRTVQSHHWGHAEVTITLDGQPVCTWLPPLESAREERFALGHLAPGAHTLRFDVERRSATPYMLKAIWIEPR